MAGSIELLPEVPDEIKAVWTMTRIGAGVSDLVGCDGWDVLARKLVDRCHAEHIINYRESETLSWNSDHKKTITICNYLIHN